MFKCWIYCTPNWRPLDGLIVIYCANYANHKTWCEWIVPGTIID